MCPRGNPEGTREDVTHNFLAVLGHPPRRASCRNTAPEIKHGCEWGTAQEVGRICNPAVGRGETARSTMATPTDYKSVLLPAPDVANEGHRAEGRFDQGGQKARGALTPSGQSA